MNEMIIGRAGRFSGNTSGSANSPQQSSCHCFANSFVVSLFMGYSKRFGVNAQKKLRHAFPGQTHLNVDGGAVIQNLRMRTMMQLTISPQPKRRSSVCHLRSAPVPLEGGYLPYKPANYYPPIQMSIFVRTRFDYRDLTTTEDFDQPCRVADICRISLDAAPATGGVQ